MTIGQSNTQAVRCIENKWIKKGIFWDHWHYYEISEFPEAYNLTIIALICNQTDFSIPQIYVRSSIRKIIATKIYYIEFHLNKIFREINFSHENISIYFLSSEKLDMLSSQEAQTQYIAYIYFIKPIFSNQKPPVLH